MKKVLFYILMISIILSGCSGQSIFGLFGGTATPTFTPTPTTTIVPTVTNTPEPQATAMATEIPIPDGFTEKLVPEIGISFWMPEDWYYMYDEQGNTAGFFVSKESVEEYGMYSTGLTVNVVSNVNDATALVDHFIDSILSADSTINVHSQDNQYLGENHNVLFRACYVDAELEIDPNDPDPASEKTIIYMGIADPEQSRVYILFFESPSNKWEDAWLNYGVYITQSIIESIDTQLLSANNN